MAKAGTLKERIDAIKKKLAEGKEKTDPARGRELRKRLKRAQRRRRSLLRQEDRLKRKAGEERGAEKKPEGESTSA